MQTEITTDLIWIVEDGFRLYGLSKIDMRSLGWEAKWDPNFHSYYWWTHSTSRAEATAFLMGATFKQWDEEDGVGV